MPLLSESQSKGLLPRGKGKKREGPYVRPLRREREDNFNTARGGGGKWVWGRTIEHGLHEKLRRGERKGDLMVTDLAKGEVRLRIGSLQEKGHEGVKPWGKRILECNFGGCEKVPDRKQCLKGDN